MNDGAIPLIDVEPLRSGSDRVEGVARRIERVCREHGFFYIEGHGIDESLVERLESLSRAFFARPVEEKLAIRMELGGRAWRGYFPVGAELTSGRPDGKEGIYFGEELPEDDPRVRRGTPLHGRNLFPRIEGFREAVLAYIDELTSLGHLVTRGIAMSLGLPAGYFREHYTSRPLVLFRIFNYPTLDVTAEDWSVGEHTDYGFLTLLHQDDRGGLEVRAPSGWIEAPPIPGTFVCNVGDMLDRLTRGLYRSTPHRVRNTSGRDRLSLPFFFDPGWDAQVLPIDGSPLLADDADTRWDRASVHAFRGTYGDYLLQKVSRVFPALRRDVL